MKHTMLRYCDSGPLDDDVARVIVAGVIAVLAENAAVDGVAALVSQYTLATGAVVAIQAQVAEKTQAAQ